MRTPSLYELEIEQRLKRDFRNGVIGIAATWLVSVVFICAVIVGA